MSSATTALLSRCRSHRRSVSPAPIKPRSTPAPASSCAYICTCSSLEPNTSPATGGGGGTGTCGSADRKNDHPAVRVDSLGLASQARSGHGIVHDLSLEG